MTSSTIKYSSTAATSIVDRLRSHGVYARPLGNVLYVMVGVTTPPEQCRILGETLLDVLRDVEGVESRDSAMVV